MRLERGLRKKDRELVRVKRQLKKLTDKVKRLKNTGTGRGGPADREKTNYGSMGEAHTSGEARPTEVGGDGHAVGGGQRRAVGDGSVDAPLGVDTPLRRRRASTEVED